MGLFGRGRGRGRRVALSKLLPADGGGGRAALATKDITWMLVIWAVLTASTVVLIYLGNPPIPYSLGDVVEREVYWGTWFSYVDEDATTAERERAAKAVLVVVKM